MTERAYPDYPKSERLPDPVFKQAKRILFCQRWGIGDVITQWPVYQALREQAPRARVVIAGANPALQLHENPLGAEEANPHTGSPTPDPELVSLQSLGIRHMGDEGDPQCRRFLEEWIQNQPPFCLMLDVLHTARALRDTLYHRQSEYRESEQSEEHQATRDGKGIAEGIAAGARQGWGLPVASPARPRLELRNAELRWAQRYLRAQGVNPDAPKPLPAMAPAASSRVKTWPMERFAQVFDAMVEDGHRQILVFAGPNERVIQDFPGLPRHPEAMVMIPAHHLRLIAALLHHCSLLICNDTGIMHLSAAVACPVVALFGPTPPEVLRPRDGVSRALYDRAFDCDYQVRGKYGIPQCWNEGQCLIAPDSCVNRVSTDEVILASRHVVRRASKSTRSQMPRTA